MSNIARCLALDFGASSIRLIEIGLAGEQLSLRECARIAHGPQEQTGHLVWNYSGLYAEIERALFCVGSSGQPVDSIGADSWGVDYVLLDEDQKLLGAPVSYRDSRTDGQIAYFTAHHLSAAKLFAATGIPALPFNTLFQLQAQSRTEPDLLERAERLLFTADYAHFWLCGAVASERSLASTSQMLGLDGRWWNDAISPLALRRSALSEPVPAGTILGELAPAVRATTGLPALKVITPATHDTQSAILAVPACDGGDWAYLSSGTWSILGVESATPYSGADALAAGLGNEQSYGGAFCVQSTVTGLWLIQEIQRLLDREDARALTDEAALAAPFRSLINPADERFFHPDNMISEIRATCRETDEPVPDSPAQLARCAYDSLALLYRQRLKQLAAITGRTFSRLHVVGGGSQAMLLNRLCAATCGIPVLAGPAEATAIGNGLAQMIALGMIKDAAEARQLVARSFPPVAIEPQPLAGLADALARFDRITPPRR